VRAVAKPYIPVTAMPRLDRRAGVTRKAGGSPRRHRQCVHWRAEPRPTERGV